MTAFPASDAQCTGAVREGILSGLLGVPVEGFGLEGALAGEECASFELIARDRNGLRVFCFRKRKRLATENTKDIEKRSPRSQPGIFSQKPGTGWPPGERRVGDAICYGDCWGGGL